MKLFGRQRAVITGLLTIFVIGLPTTGAGASSSNDRNDKSQLTTARTAQFKNCDPDDISACFADRTQANLPFRIIHKDRPKTRYVALLLHGLSDSPYFYRDIAPLFFNAGMNVISTRWAGHGTKSSDLSKVTYLNWLDDLKYARSLALEHGEKIVVAGMSMGGLGATFLLLKRPDVVAGGVLFSPALKTYSKIGQEIVPCTGTSVVRWINENLFILPYFTPDELYSKEKDYGHDVRYEKISAAGACELYKARMQLSKPQELDGIENPRFQLKGISHHGGYPKKIWYLPNGDLAPDGDDRIRKANFEGLKMPVFNVLSAYDMAVDVDVALELANSLENQENSELFFFTDGDEYSLPSNTTVANFGEVKHASVMLNPENTPVFTTEVNPAFKEMKERLGRWLQNNFSK
ncbi:MAG: alpha/beta fold hydrolase [Bdellovibrionales bacterium]|nr:alpha/beta fold hydrolase [Bdellovibrionales bacterium]